MIIPNETRDFGMVNLALGSSMYPSVRYVAQKEPGWFIQLIGAISSVSSVHFSQKNLDVVLPLW